MGASACVSGVSAGTSSTPAVSLPQGEDRLGAREAPLRPVGYRNSCRGLVLVDEPAQDIASSHVRGPRIALRPDLGSGRRSESDTTMWPGLVVVPDIDMEHTLQMPSTPN